MISSTMLETSNSLLMISVGLCLMRKRVGIGSCPRDVCFIVLGPYQYVFLQECSYMNELIFEMVR